jgi:hypothetical protein
MSRSHEEVVATEGEDRSCPSERRRKRAKRMLPASNSETLDDSDSEARRDGHVQETRTTVRRPGDEVVSSASRRRSVLADAYLSLKALAAYSGLSVRTLRGHLRHFAHPLPCYRIGGKVLVRQSEYDAWARQFRSDGPASLATVVNEVIADLR